MKLNGLVGGGTGKLGNSVFSQNAGRTIVRQYNPEVKNPNTARQQQSREIFRIANDLAKAFAPAIGIGRPRVGVLTSRNQFTKDIIPVGAGVITGSDMEFTIDYTKLPISKGGMPIPIITSVESSVSSSRITVEYNDYMLLVEGSYVPSQAGSAGLVAVVYDEAANLCFINRQSGLLNGSINVNVPGIAVGKKYQVYLFAKWVPESKNGIDMHEMPWMFPSDQSDVMAYGEFTVAE